jgi:hypothetical protein
MDETKIIQVLGGAVGGGALAGALLLILYRMTSRVVERMIAALDRVAAAVDGHTKVDLEHHAEVKTSIVRLETKFDSQREWIAQLAGEEPSTRRRTNPHGFRPLRGHHDDD